MYTTGRHRLPRCYTSCIYSDKRRSTAFEKHQTICSIRHLQSFGHLRAEMNAATQDFRKNMHLWQTLVRLSETATESSYDSLCSKAGVCGSVWCIYVIVSYSFLMFLVNGCQWFATWTRSNRFQTISFHAEGTEGIS